MPATAAAVRSARAADPWTLAEYYQFPEPPPDPARLPAWLAEVRRANYCSHPVRLAGRVDQADVATGELREAYATDHEPGGVLLKPCGNRRHGTTQPLDAWGRAVSEEATVALSTWAYRGCGYRIPQGARLAVASAVRARARTA